MDREKVMTWLEICGKNNDCSGCCPYSENGFGEYGQCRESLMADAYDLLKEQEEVKPQDAEMLIVHNGGAEEYVKDIESIVLLAHKDYDIVYCGMFSEGR